MTPGEKIKYVRKQLNITQDDLHIQTGINLTTIKKYETNRVQPLPPQIDRIAAAFDISYVALSGVDNVGLRLKTVGDLMGVLMSLISSNIICITGERDANNLLIRETVSIFFNPTLSPYLRISFSSAGSENAASENCQILIQDEKIRENLMQWERLNYIWIQAQRISDDISEEIVALTTEKEMLELDLQKDQTPLSL